MQQINQTSNKIAQEILEVPSSKTFTYPTYLADAWKAKILEINAQGYQAIQAEIEYEIKQGTTESSSYITFSKK